MFDFDLCKGETCSDSMKMTCKRYLGYLETRELKYGRYYIIIDPPVTTLVHGIEDCELYR